jgi:hypothetical protein
LSDCVGKTACGNFKKQRFSIIGIINKKTVVGTLALGCWNRAKVERLYFKLTVVAGIDTE